MVIQTNAPLDRESYNRDVLKRSNIQRELLNTTKCLKISNLAQILRGSIHIVYRQVHLILKGKIEGRRGPWRKQLSWLRNIREWTGMRVWKNCSEEEEELKRENNFVMINVILSYYIFCLFFIEVFFTLFLLSFGKKSENFFIVQV